VEQVANFKYLESFISDDGRSLMDIKTRIALAKEALNKKELLTKQLSKPLKKRIRTLVWPIALYGCETWALRKAQVDKL